MTLIFKLLFTILIFSFYFSDALPTVAGLQVSDVLVMACVAISVLFYYQRLAFPSDKLLYVILAFVVYYFVAGLVASGMGYGSGIADITPNARYLLFFIMSLLVANWWRLGLINTRDLILVVVGAQMIQFLAATQQFMSIFLGIGSQSQWIYVPTRNYHSGLSVELNWAVSGITNAQFSLAYLSLGTLAICLGYLTAIPKRANNVMLRWAARGGALASVLCILMTMRRAQILVMLLMFVGLVTFKILKERRVKTMIASVVVLLFAFGSLLIFAQYSSRFDALYALLTLDLQNPSLRTFNQRLGQFDIFIAQIRDNPFGVGLFPGNLGLYTGDNSYLNHMLWTGFIGFVLYLSAIFWSFISGCKAYFFERNQYAIFIGLALAMYCGGRLILAGTGGSGLQISSSVPFWLLIGVWLGIPKLSMLNHQTENINKV